MMVDINIKRIIDLRGTTVKNLLISSLAMLGPRDKGRLAASGEHKKSKSGLDWDLNPGPLTYWTTQS